MTAPTAFAPPHPVPLDGKGLRIALGICRMHAAVTSAVSFSAAPGEAAPAPSIPAASQYTRAVEAVELAVRAAAKHGPRFLVVPVPGLLERFAVMVSTLTGDGRFRSVEAVAYITRRPDGTFGGDTHPATAHPSLEQAAAYAAACWSAEVMRG